MGTKQKKNGEIDATYVKRKRKFVIKIICRCIMYMIKKSGRKRRNKAREKTANTHIKTHTHTVKHRIELCRAEKNKKNSFDVRS